MAVLSQQDISGLFIDRPNWEAITASQHCSAVPAGQGHVLRATAALVLGRTSFCDGGCAIPATLATALIVGNLDRALGQAGVHFSLQYIVNRRVSLAVMWNGVFRQCRKGSWGYLAAIGGGQLQGAFS